METIGFIPGRILRLYINDERIFHSTDCSINVDTAVGEIDTKDVPEGRAIIPKSLGGGLTCTALTRYDQPTEFINFQEAFQYWHGKTEVQFYMYSGNPFDFTVAGNGYITSVNNDADVSDDGSGVEMELEINGEVIIGVPAFCETYTAGNTTLEVCYTGSGSDYIFTDNGGGDYTLTAPAGKNTVNWNWYVNRDSGDNLGDIFLLFDNTANGETLQWDDFRIREEITGSFIDPQAHFIHWQQTPNGDGTTNYIWVGMQTFGLPGMTIFIP